MPNQEPTETARPTVKNWFPFVIAVLALIVATVASVVAMTNRPVGRSLNAYDLSSPQAALNSSFEMIQNKDLRAGLEWDALRNSSRKYLKEKIKTLKVHKETNFEGKVVLFFSYDREGVTQYAVEYFQKADGGQWYRTFVSTSKNATLKKSIDDWRKKGRARTTKSSSKTKVGTKKRL